MVVIEATGLHSSCYLILDSLEVTNLPPSESFKSSNACLSPARCKKYPQPMNFTLHVVEIHPIPMPKDPTLRLRRLRLIQRFPRLGTNLQHPCDTIEQALILNRLTAFQQLDIIGRRIDLLRELRLRHFMGTWLATPVADLCADFGSGFLYWDDVV